MAKLHSVSPVLVFRPRPGKNIFTLFYSETPAHKEFYKNWWN